jgi:ATP-dependent exoDNAse (exonuclease V) beta subunit
MIGLDDLKGAQLDVVRTLDQPLFVSAGAGSGKTFTLTRRVAWALTKGSAADGSAFLSGLDQVLIITFTSAAADEIKERVRSTLRAAGMVDMALQVDSAWIGTIHGMCSRILHAHALDLGIDPYFKVASQKDADLLRGMALEEVLSKARDDDAYAPLIAAYPNKPAVYVNGVKQSHDRSSVSDMLSTLVEKASSAPNGFDDMAWDGATADATTELSGVLTAYDAFLSAAIPKSDEGRASLEACSASRDELASWVDAAPGTHTIESAEGMLAALERPSGKFFRCDERKEALAAIDHAVIELSLADAATFREPLMDLARLVKERYGDLKREQSLLDNDDLLSQGLSAVRDHPDIRAAYADQFRLVMVDEFQDTSTQQVEFARLLSGPDACRLTTVGDAQQSIYRFRGADVDVFRNCERQAGDKVLRLTKNFRSHDDVLRFVAATCGQPGFLPGFMDLEANETRKDGYRAAPIPRIQVELVTSEKKKIGHTSVAPVKERRTPILAAAIADRLAELVDAGEHPGDMALLLGKMGSAGTYIDALRKRGLDCVVTGGSTFSSTPETKVMAALLHALANPADTETGLYPVLSSDLFRLDANDFCALGTCTQDMLDAPTKRTIDRGLRDMTFRPDQRPSARLLLAHQVLSNAWARLGSWPVADVVAGVVRESGWLARLEADGVNGRAVAANVLACIRYIRDLADEAGLGIDRTAVEFDAWLESTKAGPASLVGGDADVVRIMTVHSSKGLEFPVVAIAEACGTVRDATADALLPVVVDGRVHLSLKPADLKIPATGDEAVEGRCTTLLDWRLRLEEMDSQKAAAEQVRLLYVAITRAREAVVLGVSYGFSAKGVADDVLGARVVHTLAGAGEPSVGVSDVDYGGSAPLRLRRTNLTYGDTKDVVLVDAAGTFPGTEGSISLSTTPATPDQGPKPFQLFVPEDVTPPTAHRWSTSADVFSYSSAHAAERADEDADGGTRVPSADDEPDSGGVAVALGSCFHQLAQYMIETGHVPDADHVRATAHQWALVPAQRKRLDAALGRWEASAVRSELLSHGVVRAEVPFLCEVWSVHGRFLEGAIDALGTDAGSDAAFVVDYKTGDADLSADELRGAHAMQARYYAHVLYLQGYRHVTCAFVCVERDAGDGEPVVVRYGFEGDEAASL